MPVLKHSSYNAPRVLRGAHFQTIFPSLFRRVRGVTYERERIDTDDGDFLDLDFSRVHGSHLVVICHGLESSSHAAYVKGMTKAFNSKGIDAVAMNFRGCSGQINRKIRSYHSGATDDLRAVIEYLILRYEYTKICLIGFSLGGNLIVKYLGEDKVDESIAGAVVISVPCDLAASSRELMQGFNQIYMKRFMRFLNQKISAKNQILKAGFDETQFQRMRSFAEFDGAYTAPVHGFASAEDYWQKCSCAQFIKNVRVPTLMINALNDPFLSEECFPISEAEASDDFYLEMPAHGGHVGFMTLDRSSSYWHERRAVEFIDEYCCSAMYV